MKYRIVKHTDGLGNTKYVAQMRYWWFFWWTFSTDCMFIGDAVDIIRGHQNFKKQGVVKKEVVKEYS